jgi:hypothetical protein
MTVTFSRICSPRLLNVIVRQPRRRLIPVSKIIHVSSLMLSNASASSIEEAIPTHFFRLYSSPIPLCTAGLSAILSIHFFKCGKGFMSSAVKPVFSHPLTQGHVLISATLYLPLPLPARYSRASSPEYLPESWISSTP